MPNVAQLKVFQQLKQSSVSEVLVLVDFQRHPALEGPARHDGAEFGEQPSSTAGAEAVFDFDFDDGEEQSDPHIQVEAPVEEHEDGEEDKGVDSFGYFAAEAAELDFAL